MGLLSETEAKAILEKVMTFSQADECEANLEGNEAGNLRYARNTVTTSGRVSDMTLVVQSSFGKRSGTATINEFDDDSLKKVVRRSEELARLAPENPEFVSNLGPQKYKTSPAYVEATARISPEYRAQAAGASILPCREKDLTAAGFLQHGASFRSMMNRKGLFAYHRGTNVDFSVTVRTADGSGSGWASRDYNDVAKLDTGKASAVAVEKAIRSREPKAVEPGKYIVILEPAASIGLLQNMIFNFAARRADEGRSFMAKKGGGTRLGEKIVDERVTIFSDPFHPDVPTSPFTGDGRPREKTVWIEKGVVKNLFYSRYWAEKQGVKAVPPPANGIVQGGEANLEDLIRDTPRGILVTRTWYIRTVDPQTLLYTGLTRDGTFLIEDGKISRPVKNFRFNESPITMLNNLEALGRPQRIDGSLIPPMKVRDFTFTSLSNAI